MLAFSIFKVFSWLACWNGLAFKTQIVLFNAVKLLINSTHKELTLRKLKMLNLARCEIFCVRNFAPMNHLFGRPFSASPCQRISRFHH